MQTEISEKETVVQPTDRVMRVQMESSVKNNRNLDEDYLRELQTKFDKLTQEKRKFTIARLQRFIEMQVHKLGGV